MSDATISFTKQLANLSIEIRGLLNEHIADYDEVLPHVFMADVARYILADRADRAAIVQHLEKCFGQDEDVDNVIAVSFVESFEKRDDIESALRGVHGDKLRLEWLRQHTNAS